LYVCIAIGYSVAIAVSFAPLGRLPGEQPLWLVAGAALIVCGLWIRHLAMRTLAGFFTYQVEIQDDHRLVETGLYRRVRHPGYLGQLLVLAGVGVALASWLSIAAMIVFAFVAFRRRIGVEEAALQARFAGQYEAYRRRTRRLIPWLY
jgi:protein-S-isoprenylcysteine O-methyltransferase